jgi:hypothetical protein
LRPSFSSMREISAKSIPIATIIWLLVTGYWLLVRNNAPIQITNNQ